MHLLVENFENEKGKYITITKYIFKNSGQIKKKQKNKSPNLISKKTMKRMDSNTRKTILFYFLEIKN